MAVTLGRVSGRTRTAQVTWGYHSVTAAMRLLLAAAVADPANTRFQFLDETSIPLYPPHLVWAQFMHETKTRMSACEVSADCIHMAGSSVKPHIELLHRPLSVQAARGHARPFAAICRPGLTLSRFLSTAVASLEGPVAAAV